MADTEAAPKPIDAADEGIQEGFVLTGIDGLDEMLGRGVPAGHIITVLGSFGTGKTTFALHPSTRRRPSRESAPSSRISSNGAAPPASRSTRSAC